MGDNISVDERNLNGLDPKFRAVVENILLDMERWLGYRAYVASGRRSPEQQAKLVAQGRSKTMKSKHIGGLAVDIVPVDTGWKAPRDFWLKLGYLAQKHGLRWGGEFGIPKGPMLDKLRTDIGGKRWNSTAKIGWDPAHVEER